MLLPLKLPPGIYRNGTKYESRGRWYDASFVRWHEGTMRAIGGWTELRDSNGDAVDVDEPVRGMHAWRSNGGTPYLAYGTPTKAYAFSVGTQTEITPAGFSGGNADAQQTSGQYGSGIYGLYKYGVGNEAQSVLTEANTWQFDNWGQELVGCAYSDGKLYAWDLNLSNDLAQITNSPTNCLGLVVTPERFLVALGGSLGAGANRRQILWCDQEDYETWTPLTVNQAGDFILSTNGELVCGKRSRNETLLWTDVDAWTMRYVGQPFVYSIQQIGSNCGAISRNAATVIGGRAYWMGGKGFFIYDGFVKRIPSEVGDYVFSDLNRTQRSKICCVPNTQWNEVWWFYPSGGSTENDRYVVHNYVEGHWNIGNLDRTAGVDRGAFDRPIMADSGGSLYDHESGSTHDSTPYAESGPIEIGNGDRTMMVRGMIPDALTLSGVTATLYGSIYPVESESSVGPFSLANPTDIRLTARQVRLRIDESQPGWRVGVPRLDVEPGSER